ncbi:hypothetical protein BJ322DRAFT_1111731 [Thelephora terrestris]|uniref:Uncharacterized protein n=1 Tax=Thelephora terrestris TaxID=56493 RepID=A0A9P6L436_9AGAM|nr:hypothetical protein BJ322DRAFT_1111731 [Thelephora terrestris]
MTKHLWQLGDDDLVMFVVKRSTDHKAPQKLVGSLQPVLVAEAAKFTVGLWRQVIFENLAYSHRFAPGLEGIF